MLEKPVWELEGMTYWDYKKLPYSEKSKIIQKHLDYTPNPPDWDKIELTPLINVFRKNDANIYEETMRDGKFFTIVHKPGTARYAQLAQHLDKPAKKPNPLTTLLRSTLDVILACKGAF